ncbi:hypothetical protein NBRC10513v2_003710 [Rhodotorula toruloides]
MPPTTRRASAAQTASTTAVDAQDASEGVQRANEGGGDEGHQRRQNEAMGQDGQGQDDGQAKHDVFSTLPMDIVLQIAVHLDPGTLLAIGQTSKSIRSTLFRKSAEPIWVAARRNVGLQDLHQLMSEPMYAFLLCGRACEVCGTTKRETTLRLDLQARACSKCLEKNVCLASTLEEEIHDLHPLTTKCCMSTPYSHTGKRSVSRKPFYWFPEARTLSWYLHTIDLVAARTDRTKIRPSTAAIAFQAEMDEFKTAAEADVAIFEEGFELVEKAKSKDEQERAEWRFRQIQIRLMNAGFNKEDTLAVPLSVKNSSRTVDEDYWELVKDRVIKAVQTARDKRVEQEQKARKKQLSKLYTQLCEASSSAEKEFFPSAHAFLRLPTVEPLWHPEDSVVDPSSWPALAPTIRLDLRRQARIDKIRFSHQLAIALLSLGTPLPDEFFKAVTLESSHFLDDEDESKGIAPLHDRLTDQQLSLFLDNPLALFLCNACKQTCHVKEAGLHFQDAISWCERNDVEIEARFYPAASPYLQLLHRCLVDAGFYVATTTCADLAELGMHLEVQLRNGNSILVDWAALSTGEYVDRGAWCWITTYNLIRDATSISNKPPPASPAPQESPTIPSTASTSGGTSG